MIATILSAIGPAKTLFLRHWQLGLSVILAAFMGWQTWSKSSLKDELADEQLARRTAVEANKTLRETIRTQQEAAVANQLRAQRIREEAELLRKLTQEQREYVTFLRGQIRTAARERISEVIDNEPDCQDFGAMPVCPALDRRLRLLAATGQNGDG